MKQSNRNKRLLARIRDYSLMMQQNSMSMAGRSGVSKRMDNGGYHKPGSNNK